MAAKEKEATLSDLESTLMELEEKVDQALEGQARLETKLDQALADGKGLQTEVGALKGALATQNEWLKRMVRIVKAK